MKKTMRKMLCAIVMLLTLCSFTAMAEEAVQGIMDKILVVYNMNQKTKDNTTYYPLHVYAGIDSLAYQEVGFEMRAESTDLKAEKSNSTRVVYQSMNVTDHNGEVTKYAASDLGGAYMFGHEMLFTAGKWYNKDTTVYVTPYAIRKDGTKITGKELTLSDAIIKQKNPASALFKEVDVEVEDPEETPDVEIGNLIASGSTAVTPSEDGKVTGDGVLIDATDASAEVPAGVSLEEGTTELTLSVAALDESASNVETGETEELAAFDVNIKGVSEENNVPILVTVDGMATNGLNNGNIKLYHVEKDGTKEMTRVDSVAELNAHNQFAYDATEGTLTMSLASFSEVSVVADTVNAWNGTYDEKLNGSGTQADPYIISNADELAGLSNLVSGNFTNEGVDKTKDYGSAYYKLNADINFGGEKSSHVFYPIGYRKVGGTGGNGSDKVETWYTYGGAFSGTFDGAGHTISNIYQNTWSMDGNYDKGYWDEAMGLFGYVNGGTVKNLTMENFQSDGEFTPTGCVAAYATNSTFENIALVNCNPRVYNTGNGGIVGIGGNSDDPDTYKLTFTNITIDNSNKISALWGSWDVACGGLVGMFRGAGHVYMTNCHVAAQIDVFNDVCGNYQYYWYRYAGMLVGTNKNMTTDANGYTVPETTKFHAENCTVHFGDWNNYYYCELVANSLASYTHDHQFSRLTEVKSVDVDKKIVTALDGTTTTIPASGRYNYVVIKDDSKPHATENAECYHFVNGVEHKHDVADADNPNPTETVDGVEGVLKENNQHIFLPFNQLFTGYGWGVKHIPIYDDGKNYFDGVTILDREIANSFEKFEALDVTKVENELEIKIGTLFKALDDVEISQGSVYVSVTSEKNADGTDKVTAVYTEHETDWTQGTIKFTGTGKVTLTIQDYNWCKPTTLTVDILDEVTKFAKVFTNEEQLYRVGNQNNVALSSLFRQESGVTMDHSNVSVDVELLENAGTAEGIENLNKTNWTLGTIDFNNEGVVRVTIKEGKVATTLLLEVVNAYNATTYTDMQNDQSTVMLNDITMSNDGTKYYTGNDTLYGNGFTFDVTDGANGAASYGSASYVISLKNSNLNNVKITGMVYPEYGASHTEQYNRAIVMTSGDCTIANSYISNGASPIRNGGKLELVNTTLKGGNYANLDHQNGHLILDNVTTINQVRSNEKTEAGNVVVGLGIVVYQEGGSEDLKITVRNGLTQYNYISQAEANTYIKDTNAKVITSQIFSNSNFSSYLFDDGTTEWANTGIISMNNYITAEDIIDERNDKQGYYSTTATVTLANQSRKCCVYTAKPTAVVEAPEYISVGQYKIHPNVSFDNTENYDAKENDTDYYYCYLDEEANTVYIGRHEEDDSVTWNPSIMTATKFGVPLSYNVTMDDVDITNQTQNFESRGEHIVEYSYTDAYNFSLDENGNLKNESFSYTKTLNINVAVKEKDAQNAVFSFGANGTAYSARKETSKTSNKTYVMPDVNANVSGKIGSITVDGVTVYYPITEMYTSDGKTEHTGSWYACFPIFKDAVQIIDYADAGKGDEVSYNQTTVTTVAGIPSTLKATNPTTAFLYQMKAATYPPPTDPTAVSSAVCYTCNRSGLTASNERNEMTITAEYTYTDNAGATYYYYVGYHCAKQTDGGCLVEGSLITLADGSQKAVEDLVVGDMILVFNHVTGKTEVAPLIFNTHEVEEEKNYDVLTLQFADGNDIEIVESHGFFDTTIMQYVYIDYDNYTEYIGHSFYKLGENGGESVELINGFIDEKLTRIFCPVTYFHMNSFANGYLNTPNIPGKITGLVNYFEYDADLKYNEEAMQRDIETYGLYTYEDFSDYISYEAYLSSPSVHLKVAVGKGMITYEEIIGVIQYLLEGSLID